MLEPLPTPPTLGEITGLSTAQERVFLQLPEGVLMDLWVETH